MSVEKQPALSEANQQMATYLAMVIRNAMEDFHCEHLSDQQMKQLNPIIRNAVATALHAFDHYDGQEPPASLWTMPSALFPLIGSSRSSWRAM